MRDQILAGIFDLLAHANWQRAGKRHAPRPKPLQRPWEKRRGRQIGSKPIPIRQFNDWWESKRKERR
ncbi:hypothetical protein [Agrococcus casei]|uniref:Uncharacterized protein n=1 Tax=Agrococcus casei LMG 22410 TaxID=1255656 RepID=A0A1R4FHD9_9MICO|nr:hypothetical protein [Agrococcus casei]SJM55273.1 hypothetical protein CZ674_04530 [Agrococcus casei LMG 22410]